MYENFKELTEAFKSGKLTNWTVLVDGPLTYLTWIGEVPENVDLDEFHEKKFDEGADIWSGGGLCEAVTEQDLIKAGVPFEVATDTSIVNTNPYALFHIDDEESTPEQIKMANEQGIYITKVLKDMVFKFPDVNLLEYASKIVDLHAPEVYCGVGDTATDECIVCVLGDILWCNPKTHNIVSEMTQLFYKLIHGIV